MSAPRRWAQRLRRTWPRTPASIAITIALGVNLLVAGAYLWSRGGETIHLRMVAQDDHFTVFVNGREQASARLEAAATGGIRLTVADTGAIPSLPTPRGIDSVRVTDLATNAVLFQDDFSRSPRDNAAWRIVGTPLVNGGAVGAGQQGVTLQSFGHPWHNYAVDVTYRNIVAASVRVRAADEQNGVDFSFRPFRHLDNSLSLLVNGKTVTSISGPTLKLSPQTTIRSMLWTLLDPYPKVALLLLVGLIAVAVLQFVPAETVRALHVPLPRAAPWLAVGAMAAVAFAVTLFLGYVYGSHMPHVPDSVSYVFQAKVLAAGHLSAPAPPSPAFDFFFPPLIEVHHGRWASVYPFGHPLVLAVGELFRAIWLVPPLIGAAGVALMFAVGRRLYNVRTALLAALLLAGSPFFMMSASDYMSHNTAAFYVLLSVLFLVLHDRRPLLFPFLSGVFFGLLFNTRPLTAAGLVAPYGVMLLSFLVPRNGRKLALKQIVAFAAGGLLMLLAYYLYTWGATGSPFTISATQANKNNVGFGGTHTLAAGVSNDQTQLAMLALVLNDWPVYLGLVVVLLPFILGTRNRWDWFFLACAAMAMGVYTLYYSPGIMHGPRYWYEATPFLLLLTARGVDRAARLLAAGAAHLRTRLLRTEAAPAEWAGVSVTYAFVVVLIAAGAYGWLRGDGKPWRIDLMPAHARDLRGFNGANDAFTRTVAAAHLHNALVLMQPCPNWQCYGTVFWTMSPWLTGNVVYARNLDGGLQPVFDAFPDRRVYIGDWAARTLLPYGATPAAVGPSQGPATAPRAKEIPTEAPRATPTPAPTPTIDVALASRRDTARRKDLDAVAAALDRYRSQHGAYPQVNGVQTLCGYPSDVGCVLKKVLDPLPTDPRNNQSYWYTSDGTSFTLFAEMEEAPGPSQCPNPAPEHLAGVPNLYCVHRGSG
ncbi:MAG TPA: glycosyltransferase family 39 protein [Dehalococcoidia bacterium]|nr:glycosyltransferase family 39 protein [Dehalococcoidia bacterium]